MTQVLAVPSEQVRGTAGFTCALPDGWYASESAGVLAKLAGPDGVEVVVSSVRVDAEMDLRSVAVRSFAQQRQVQPDARIDSQRVGRFGDRTTYLRSVQLPGSPERAQLQALFFAPDLAGRAVADVFSIVGTCAATEIGDQGHVFVDIVASFAFT